MTSKTLAGSLMTTILLFAAYVYVAPGNSTHASSTAAKGPAVTVYMQGDSMRFSPATVTIHRGQTVEWQNLSSTQTHNVVDDPSLVTNPADAKLPKGTKPFSSALLREGSTYEHTFTVPGTYRYACTPHEIDRMVGTVIVK
jgi:plastocyanin